MKENPLVEIKNIHKTFLLNTAEGAKPLHALTDVSLAIHKGETLSVIGESGCGKTTLGKIVLRLLEANSGTILFEGKDICQKNTKEMKLFRKDAQMIFQNPFASLNPRRTIESTIKQPLNIHYSYTKKEINERIDSLLLDVGISPKLKNRHPHEFSGGQRQRINIARALASQPKFIVCDEAVSALDVSIQAQILNLLVDLKEKYQLTYLFISHDLGTVNFISDKVCVMYLGKAAEIAPNNVLAIQKLHPYTNMLFESHPIPDPTRQTLKNTTGMVNDIPSPLNMPSGCPFSSRCKYTTEICRTTIPEIKNYGSKEVPHFAACHHISDNIATISN